MRLHTHKSYLAVGIAGAIAVIVSCGSSGGGGFGPDGGGGSGGSSGGGGNSSGGGAGGGAATGGAAAGGSGTGTGGSAAAGSGAGGSAIVGDCGSSSKAPDAGSCSATIATGAITLDSHFQDVLGDGGYAFSYEDTGGSTACIDATAACISGTTTTEGTFASDSGAVGSYSANWGAGLGFNLNQTKASGTTGGGCPNAYPIPSSSTGVTYSISSLPTQGMRLVIGDETAAHTGTDYCAIVTATSGTIPWASFSTDCWNTATAGNVTLSGPPTDATHLNFEVVSAAAATPFDFCVTSVSFGGGTGTGGSGGSGGGGGSGGTGQTCVASSLPSNSNGEITCYDFGQGTSTGGGCSSYKTYCGYCGTESGGTGSSSNCFQGTTDTIQNTSTGNYFAAMATTLLNNGEYCGMCVSVTYNGKSQVATIVDECATCPNSNHIDLSEDLAQYLGLGQGGSTGDATNGVTWEAVSCPVTGNIYAFYNNGSPTGGVYFQNTRFPVTSISGHSVSDGIWNVNAGETVTLSGGGETVSCTLPASSGEMSCQFPAPSSCTAP